MTEYTVLSLLVLLNSLAVAAGFYAVRKTVRQIQVDLAVANSRTNIAEARLSRLEWDNTDLGKNIAQVQATGVWPAGPGH